MIKDVFYFNKNSWHLKLMKWIWNFDHTNFRNMCPYFWLSVFNVIFIIPILLLKGFVVVSIFLVRQATIIVETIVDYLEKKEGEWIEGMEKRIEESLKKNKYEYEDFLFYKRIMYSKCGKYRRLKYNITFDTRDRLWDVIDEYNRKGALEELENTVVESTETNYAIKEKKQLTKEQRIAKLTVFIKKSAKIILAFGGVGLIYLLFLFGKWAMTWNWAEFWSVFLTMIIKFSVLVLFVLVFATVVYLIIRLIAFLWCEYGRYCIPCDERRNNMNQFFKYLVLPFTLIWEGIKYVGIGIKLLWDILIALKNNNCPGIIWDEEENK